MPAKAHGRSWIAIWNIPNRENDALKPVLVAYRGCRPSPHDGTVRCAIGPAFRRAGSCYSWNVVVLLPRVSSSLWRSMASARAMRRARGVRADHLVDVSALGGHERRKEALFVFLRARAILSASPMSARKMIRLRPSRPSPRSAPWATRSLRRRADALTTSRHNAPPNAFARNDGDLGHSRLRKANSSFAPCLMRRHIPAPCPAGSQAHRQR